MKLEDDDLRALEMMIMSAPAASPVIPGTRGARKIRFAPPSWHTGKRGAMRVIYAFFEPFSIVLLITAYTKNRKDNLSAAEKNEIASLIVEIEDHLNTGIEGSPD
jgi:hypothetical protein